MAYNKNDYSYSQPNQDKYYGLGFAFRPAGKFLAIDKSSFLTFEQASDYVGNSGDTAVAGAVITVTDDEDVSKNGIYCVMKDASKPNGLSLVRSSGDLTITESEGSTSGVLKTYTFSSNGTVINTIDIPKDFFIKSASAYTITTQEQVDETGVPSGHTCWDLVLNTKDDDTEKHSYVDITNAIILDAKSIMATPISANTETVAISGNTVAEQLKAIGIQIKKNVPSISEQNGSNRILATYDDGIGILSGASWDCGVWGDESEGN